MSKSIKMIFNQFPLLSSYLEDSENIAKKELGKEEFTFLQLVKFFDNPSENSFDLKLLFLNLEGKWLAFALDSLQTYFKEDTYLMPEDKSTTIYDHDPMLNQTDFAQFLSDNGLPFDRRKFSIYKSRGVMPYPDLEIAGIPYWKKSTAQTYIDNHSNSKDLHTGNLQV